MDDQFDAVDVHTTRCDVGGHKGLERTVGPPLEGPLARALRHATVHCDGADTEIVECLRCPLGGEAVLHEHDGAAGGVDEERQVLELAVVAGRHGEVLGSLQNGVVILFPVGAGDGVVLRVGHVLLDELIDVAVERRRVQQCLTGRRTQVQEPRHLGGEAHIGHTVGLVDDDQLDVAEVALAAVHEVGETARCGDGDVDAALEITDLAHHGRAAEEGGDPASLLTGVRGEDVGHLLGQLTGRDQDQCLGGSGPGLGATLQQRKPVGEGLAGTGGRLRAHVLASDGVRKGCFLDGEWGLDAIGTQRGYQARLKAERVKRRHESFLLSDVRGGWPASSTIPVRAATFHFREPENPTRSGRAFATRNGVSCVTREQRLTTQDAGNATTGAPGGGPACAKRASSGSAIHGAEEAQPSS